MKPVFKPVFSKPVFVSLALVALASGCTMQNGTDPIGKKREPISPQPTVCAGLDVDACGANPACEAVRVSCPPCEVNYNCAATTCFECRDKQHAANPCEGLSETQCQANAPLCFASYLDVACAMVMPQDGGTFECKQPYAGCFMNLPPQDPCAGLPESACVAPFCRPIYSASLPIACDPSGNCNSVPPPGYLGCELNVTSCDSNCDCAVNEYCHVELMEPEPMPVITVDGGVSSARCMAAPLPVGVCKRVPGIDPVPVVDAGATPSAP